MKSMRKVHTFYDPSELMLKAYSLILPADRDAALVALDKFLRQDEPLYQRLMLDEIAHPPDLSKNPKWKTPIGEFQLRYNRLCLSEFIKRNVPFAFLPKLNYESLLMEFHPDTSDSFKNLITAEVTLWIAIWRIAARLSECGGMHKSFILNKLIYESSGLSPRFRFNPGKNCGFDEIHRQIQFENHALDFGETTFENPFNAEIQPFTHHFVSKGWDMGETPEARKDWVAIVKARKALTAIIAKSKPESIQKDGSKTKRGRPPKGKMPAVDGTEDYQESLEYLKNRGFILNIP